MTGMHWFNGTESRVGIKQRSRADPDANATREDIADILGNSPVIVRKHYAKWSPARQKRIDDLMAFIRTK